MPKVSVLIPVYNEATTVTSVLDRVLRLSLPIEIVVVDDGSTDGTGEVLRRFVAEQANAASERVKIVTHPKNRGKGAALQTAIANMTGEIAVVQDADLEYSPSDIPGLIQPILDGVADVVYGSRFTGSPRRVLLFWHTVGNKLLTLTSNMATNLNLTDVETGYKAFRAEVLRSFPIRSRGFGVEPELTAKVAHLRYRIYEVPISYHGRTYAEGKKIGWKDGFVALATIARFRVSHDVAGNDDAFRSLRRVDRLTAYTKFLADLVHPWAGNDMLEIGSGTGSVTQHLSSRATVTATDIDPRYLELLTRDFEHHPNVAVRALDVTDKDATGAFRGRFDSVLCANVLEHLEDDTGALRNMRQMIAPGGRIVLIVPALPKLHGELDKAIGHFRRYSRKEIERQIESAGLEVEHLSHVNALGALGWYINSVLLKRTSLPGVQARVNDLLTPLLRFERRLKLPVGLSMLVVARDV